MEQVGRFADEAARLRFTGLYAAAMRRWPAHTRCDVDTTYGPTAVHRAGSAAPGAVPVVLVHGGGATSASWADVVPVLGADRPVLAVDTLGDAGRSVQRAPLPTAADRARWLDEVLAGLGLDRVHLVGGSMGGWIALNQAVHRPDRLASVTAAEPAGALTPIAARVWVRLLAVQLSRSPRTTSRFLRWTLGGRTPPPAIADLLVSALRDHRTRGPAPQRLTAAQLRAITQPVLVLLGAESPVHDVRRAADRARRHLALGQVEVVPGAAHNVFAGQPAAVQVLRAFLRNADR
jgi:pimeloyl-ACP methyl ester carboxylesterase